MTFRVIPSVERLRQMPHIRLLEAKFGHEAVVDALRSETAVMRDRIARGDVPEDVAEAIAGAVPERLRLGAVPSLQRVINATGVIVHTNLGRAPLSRGAVERIAALAPGYTNLEYDVARGARGRRDEHAERLICRLTGARAAVVVNNNAAATLLSLAALAAGREVIISRGELVEIGGGFRVPDVMAQSGAVLREVGTTNRTRTADYAAAISDRTALILRVHPSNFRIEGFTERPTLEALVALGHRFNIPVSEDLGSGFLGVPAGIDALRDEPDVAASVAAGAALVMFSGDKLLGGPQAGIIVGTESAVSQVRAHPLMRALRVDKLTYAALEATLESYVVGRALDEVPVPRMIAMTAAEIGDRAGKVAAALPTALEAAVVDGQSTIGGGSAPGSTLPTRLIALRHPGLTSDAFAGALRSQHTPVIGRIENDRVVLDLRTVAPEDDERIIEALRTVEATPGQTSREV
jgi:L-seryl-tRNA(Ser) seleniumtransferase